MSTFVRFNSIIVIRSSHTSRYNVGRKMSTFVRFSSMIVIRGLHTSRHNVGRKMSISATLEGVRAARSDLLNE